MPSRKRRLGGPSTAPRVTVHAGEPSTVLFSHSNAVRFTIAIPIAIAVVLGAVMLLGEVTHFQEKNDLQDVPAAEPKYEKATRLQEMPRPSEKAAQAVPSASASASARPTTPFSFAEVQRLQTQSEHLEPAAAVELLADAVGRLRHPAVLQLLCHAHQRADDGHAIPCLQRCAARRWPGGRFNGGTLLHSMTDMFFSRCCFLQAGVVGSW